MDTNERSSRWYQEALGFANVFTMRRHDGTPFLAHLCWCRVQRFAVEQVEALQKQLARELETDHAATSASR